MTIQERTFKGHPFKIACKEVEGFQHPSWFSFDDESGVRDRDWNIKPGDVVLDVGAAYGSYALTALAAGAAIVYAWTPQGPPNEETEAEMLAESLALNGWEDRCVLYTSGVYDRAGWLNASSQEFTTVPPENRSGDVIAVGRLDDWFWKLDLPKVDWMKLDVEGAEVEVFRGAEKLIAEFRPNILVENHEFKRAGIGGEVCALLEGWGYAHVSTHPYHAVSHSVFRPNERQAWQQETPPSIRSSEPSAGFTVSSRSPD